MLNFINKQTKNIIKEIIITNNPQTIFVLFSGSKDSTVLLHNTVETLLNINNQPKLTIIHLFIAMRVYNSSSPYIYTYGAYTYNALPLTATMSGCKLISIIRRTQGFPKPAYWAIENYKICGGNIAEVENTNMAGWDNLPNGIKPVINNVIQEARQYGKANADYDGYRVIGKAQAYNNAVYVYVLNGIKLESMMMA